MVPVTLVKTQFGMSPHPCLERFLFSLGEKGLKCLTKLKRHIYSARLSAFRSSDNPIHIVPFYADEAAVEVDVSPLQGNCFADP